MPSSTPEKNRTDQLTSRFSYLEQSCLLAIPRVHINELDRCRIIVFTDSTLKHGEDEFWPLSHPSKFGCNNSTIPQIWLAAEESPYQSFRRSSAGSRRCCGQLLVSLGSPMKTQQTILYLSIDVEDAHVEPLSQHNELTRRLTKVGNQKVFAASIPIRLLITMFSKDVLGGPGVSSLEEHSFAH